MWGKRLTEIVPMKKKRVFTIDGPAGAGKSTISRLLAERLSCLYLDTGALYRAVACRLIQKGFSGREEEMVALCGEMKVALQEIGGRLHVMVDGQDVTDKIRTEEIGLLASRVSSLSPVRKALLSIQRQIGAAGEVVAEGRDMGTVVFPDAMVKFFLDASVRERAVRRHLELTKRGEHISLDDVEKDIIQRDRQDRERTVSPLCVPPDAVIVDSTDKSITQILNIMMDAINDRKRTQE
jgi:cytidylate kinase